MQASALGFSSGKNAPQPTLSAQHLADVERALVAARDSAAPCLLRCEFPLQDADILARFAPTALAGELPFVFHTPRGAQTILAWGAIEIAHGAAGSRFASAVEHCSRVRELAMVGVSDRTPLWVGGAAFAPGTTRELFAADAWAGWPDARFYIPRTMLLAEGDSARAVITTWVRPADQRDAIVTTLLEELAALGTPAHKHGQASGMAPRVGRNAWVSLEAEDAWAKRVEAACDVIGAGGMDKVVLARATRLKTPRGAVIDPLRTLTNLIENHPAATCFLVGNDDGSFFVGATPETLLEVKEGWVETHALAGTAPRGATPREDDDLAAALVASAKNREEHDVVAHALRARLAAHCTVLEAGGEQPPQLVKLTHVQHLETVMRGKLASAEHILSLAAELHPTPAVGGFPFDRAAHYLAESEPLARGWYSGPVGVVSSSGEGALVVAIRSMMLRGDRAWAFAGGGIVATSNPRDEWRETELKLAGITDSVGLELETAEHERPASNA